MFGHLILKQAQATRGGAMPSGIFESPFSISLVRTPARSSTLHQDTEKMGFGNSYICLDETIHFHPRHVHAAIHDVFFLIRDSDSPTHNMLIRSRQPSDTNVSLVQNNSN